ncbi:gamma-glutamylcyclotransferase [Marinilongibacter aquaticus]|uniref:gamma-glutamylcyclotransferase family protein n=1 Tax=Marinilongibacter aquaticus TaxID=2975157 RepID=UPI0021BDB3EA|nr:gamma-glutamylcyclotransferase family protein [Marinilongibacter aquaticus]UBM59120.1 gamma-glutamylcyclotransferase [Marinilongibacter aquaticus]
MDYLFVYGTLMQKWQGNAWSALLHQNAEYCGEGKVEGQLYKIDFYPGLVKGDGEVFGEIWRLKAPEKLLPLLDEYEDFIPARPEESLYIRTVADVTDIKKSSTLRCWTYFYNRSVDLLPIYPKGRFA